MPLLDAVIEPIVRAALLEDVGRGADVSAALLPEGARFTGLIRARKAGTIAGLQAARLAFRLVDDGLTFTPMTDDGAKVETGAALARIEGRAASIVTAERTALNFLQRLSGIATLTRRFVDAVACSQATILDTRKTLPGYRVLDKYAVRMGGGVNHRMSLYDMILIKDNHLAALDGGDEVQAVNRAVRKALRAAPGGIRVQVEVTSVAAALEAGRSGAHMVLLDNMTASEMADAVQAMKREFGEKRPLVEASGGISLETVKAAAAAGVDRISVGALTHSAPALDIAMYIGFD